MIKTFWLMTFLIVGTVKADPISPVENYQYTNLYDMTEAVTVWNSMKANAKNRSECFNRALSWVYDMDKEFGIKSRKIILHYSYKFNKELSAKWGFHIAPLLSVRGKDYVFDRKFMQEPVTTDYWLNWFIGEGKSELIKLRAKTVKNLRSYRQKLRNYRRGKIVWPIHYNESDFKKKIREYEDELKYLQVTETGPVEIKCKKITHIEELDYNQEKEWCYYQEVNMYYWGIPQLRLLNYGHTKVPHIDDLPRAREKGKAYARNTWNMDDVWAARKEAFSDYDEIWEDEYILKEREEDKDSFFGRVKEELNW